MSEDRFSILLVDDDEVDRMMVRRALRKADFSVLLTEAKNGSEALVNLDQSKTNLAGSIEIKRRQKFEGRGQKVNCSDGDLDPNRTIQRIDDGDLDPQGISLKDNPSAFCLLPPAFQGGSLVNLVSSNGDLSNNIFDLILLDYRLPDIDGLNLITEIKALNIDSPIIVLTGQGDEEIAVEIMKAGAVDYLSKSKIRTDTNNLDKAISSAIRLDRAEQAVKIANHRLRASNELLVLKNQELEKQQEQIKLQNIKLQEAYKLKSEFLATMSHELRTPMNAIMGFSQLLLRQYPDPLSEQQNNLIQRIFDNSKSLLDMINEMLDFSKIEAGKLQLNPQTFDLNYLIKLTIEELRSLTIAKQLDLVTDINLKNVYLTQDSNFVKRILINLLSNAIKFTELGKITVKAWEIDDTKIGISVIDTGIGIAEEDKDKIFQAFRQGDQSFTRQHSGTGLGLAITESLVKMMAGNISLQSELGKGSTFMVEIPRKYDV